MEEVKAVRSGSLFPGTYVPLISFWMKFWELFPERKFCPDVAYGTFT